MHQQLGRLKKIGLLFGLSLLSFLAILVGVRYFDDRKYLLVSFALIMISFFPFLLLMEKKRRKAREYLAMATLCAIVVLSRAVFFMVPAVKPVAALVIIIGTCLGAEAGFFVGSVAMLVSNILFGQGPWTPWQMLAMGLVGGIAGVIFHERNVKLVVLSIYSFFSVILIYGVMMNTASLVMMSSEINKETLYAIFLSGLPVDTVHAVSTIIFLWLFYHPMEKKLCRLQIKYGLFQKEKRYEVEK